MWLPICKMQMNWNGLKIWLQVCNNVLLLLLLCLFMNHIYFCVYPCCLICSAFLLHMTSRLRQAERKRRQKTSPFFPLFQSWDKTLYDKNDTQKPLHIIVVPSRHAMHNIEILNYKITPCVLFEVKARWIGSILGAVCNVIRLRYWLSPSQSSYFFFTHPRNLQQPQDGKGQPRNTEAQSQTCFAFYLVSSEGRTVKEHVNWLFTWKSQNSAKCYYNPRENNNSSQQWLVFGPCPYTWGIPLIHTHTYTHLIVHTFISSAS